jgi:hypothetical protein
MKKQRFMIAHSTCESAFVTSVVRSIFDTESSKRTSNNSPQSCPHFSFTRQTNAIIIFLHLSLKVRSGEWRLETIKVSSQFSSQSNTIPSGLCNNDPILRCFQSYSNSFAVRGNVRFEKAPQLTFVNTMKNNNELIASTARYEEIELPDTRLRFIFSSLVLSFGTKGNEFQKGNRSRSYPTARHLPTTFDSDVRQRNASPCSRFVLKQRRSNTFAHLRKHRSVESFQ